MKFNSSCNENFNIKSRNLASKNPAVSALQDLLFYQLSVIGFFLNNSHEMKIFDEEINEKVVYLLYLTNKGINFSIPCMMRAVKEAFEIIQKTEVLYKKSCKLQKKKAVMPSTNYYKTSGENLSEMVSLANIINSKKTIEFENFDIFTLQELLRQSLCTSITYLNYIIQEEKFESSIFKKIYEILDFLSDEKRSLENAKNFLMKVGEINYLVMEELFDTLIKKYGYPGKTKVNISRKKGPAILVVGDDFKFLKELLEKTKNKNINIYTYGNLNYAHAFKEFQKYKHLKGIYFGKYTNITGNIETFQGAVVLSSGNIENIDDIFRGRIFSTEEISILGVGNIKKDNIQPLLNAAYDSEGYSSDEEDKFITLGFDKNEINKISEQIYSKLKNKKNKKLTIFLGCNNNIKKNNNLFISLGCFEYEYFKNSKSNKKENVKNIINFGPLSNIYIVIKMLFFLKGKFKQDFSKMPIEIIINLQNSSSIAVLFTLLSFDIKNIKINSELSLYLTNCILKIFGEKYNLSKTNQNKLNKSQYFEQNLQ